MTLKQRPNSPLYETNKSDSEVVEAVVYATMGLLDVAESEVRQLAGSVEADRGPTDRYFRFRCTWADLKVLASKSRTLDDVRLLVGQQRRLATECYLEQLLADAAGSTSRTLGPDRAPIQRWSVTVSARKPIWRRKDDWEVDHLIARHFRGASPDDLHRQPADLRIQIDGDEAHVALNVTHEPIGKAHRWLDDTRVGSLRPTVPGSLVGLAHNAASPLDRPVVYDPCCGTGTILEEALLAGADVYGSDIDPEAVLATRGRLGQLVPDCAVELTHRLFVRSIEDGLPARVGLPICIANLPWNEQVKVASRRAIVDAAAEIAVRCANSGGAAVQIGRAHV